MTIRVKLRSDKKAMTRFGDRHEELWFINLIRSIRDSDPKTHPAISIRENDREIPRLPPPKPIPPEMLEKMKMEKVEKKTNEMKK